MSVPAEKIAPDTFEHIRTQRIPTLNIAVEEYRHRETLARHYHLAADDPNNAFLVAFLTVPQDSTGVAHILEHTSLCGSDRFAVRDPFFMMTRRSLNTFMNAFTSSDWTAYPFASQNQKDFNNLLEVYLDAAFFPRLDPLDFAQEGHRLEFADPQDPGSALEYKGVVFNEMKGAMSSPVRTVWQRLQSELFPSTTYHHNSGGDPQRIPDLSYAGLKAFHARHYHPSNAVFMTYGAIPAVAHQERFERLALSRFRGERRDLFVPPEQRYDAPRVVLDHYPLDGESDTRRRTHVVLGWLLGDITDLTAQMEAHLLSGVLLDNGSSPLRHALENTDLGTSPSELMGVDDSTREMTFVCGLEGSEPERAEQVEALVLRVVKEVADQGVAQEVVESVLHQIELSQREIGGGHFPYGLQLMVNALGPAIHGGDPVAVLNLDPVLAKMRERIRDPEYIKGLARRLLFENPHRVRLTMAPDPELSARRAGQEAERLAAIREALTDAERQTVVEQAQALQARQMQEDDPEVLPKVTLEDVPPDMKIVEGSRGEAAGAPVSRYAQPTNGLVYEQVVVDLPQLEPELVDLLPLFCECLTEVGVGAQDYCAIQARQAAVTGGISARISLRGGVDDVQSTHGVFVLGSKALARNQGAMTTLLQETFTQARFDELARLRELVAQMRAYREASVTDRGHAFAMTAAAAGLAPAGALAHRWSGLAGIKRLKALDDSLQDEAALAAFGAQLEQIRDALVAAPRQFLLVGEADQLDAMAASLEQAWNGGVPAGALTAPFAAPSASGRVREGWSTSTQVHFLAAAYPTVPSDHPDAAALAVLGGFLRNGFLHRAVREQGGAYGAGAAWDSDTASFRFFSYRDPRLADTLKDFQRAIDWLLSERHSPRVLEEAILGVISSIDRPESPAGEAVSAFFAELHGRTAEKRRRFRRRILEVSLEDLRRVAEIYLRPEQASIALVSNGGSLAKHAEELDVVVQHL